jgi:hypothetical protein
MNGKCKFCGEPLLPTDSLESPISGETVSPYYECENNCEYIEWMKQQGRYNEVSK